MDGGKRLLDPAEEPLVRAEGVVREPPSPEPGLALCLSGGGYRAMLFHVGALWRLNELKLLIKIRRISSVSGGSITAGALGANWRELRRDPADPDRFDQATFEKALVHPIRRVAEQTIDVKAIGWGLVSPWRSISDEVACYYRRYLFGDKTLQDLPDEPRFVINATNVKTGALWRFSKPYMADYRVGMVRKPDVPLSVAVAASSAFPPFLSPVSLKLDPTAFDAGIPSEFASPEYRSEAVLTDGGVYDNLGIETAWKRYDTILVSDGGRNMAADPAPNTDWARHSYRLIELLSQQISNLRQRQLVEAFQADIRRGALWSIRTPIAKYGLADTLNCPPDHTAELAETPTRLACLPSPVQERLINWGYAACDAAVRRYFLSDASVPASFPYPTSGV